MSEGHDPAVTIRSLAPPDAAACDAIILGLPYHFGDPGGREECARAVRRDRGLVAVAGGEVVGFLTVVHHFPASAEITWMAVRADRRGGGIGGQLIEHLCAALADEGCRLVLVLTLS
jgi:predicted N-acetyltransferase YhbS